MTEQYKEIQKKSLEIEDELDKLIQKKYSDYPVITISMALIRQLAYCIHDENKEDQNEFKQMVLNELESTLELMDKIKNECNVECTCECTCNEDECKCNAN